VGVGTASWRPTSTRGAKSSARPAASTAAKTARRRPRKHSLWHASPATRPRARSSRLSAVVDAGQTEVTTLSASVVALRSRAPGSGGRAGASGGTARRREGSRAGRPGARAGAAPPETISAESGRSHGKRGDGRHARAAHPADRGRARRRRGDRGGGRESARGDRGRTGGTRRRLRRVTACRVDLASATERVEALGRELPRLDETGATGAAASPRRGSVRPAWRSGGRGSPTSENARTRGA